MRHTLKGVKRSLIAVEEHLLTSGRAYRHKRYSRDAKPEREAFQLWTMAIPAAGADHGADADPEPRKGIHSKWRIVG